MGVLNLVLSSLTLATIVGVVALAFVSRRDDRRRDEERAETWGAIFELVEDDARRTRHAVDDLTAALKMEERVKGIAAARNGHAALAREDVHT